MTNIDNLDTLKFKLIVVGDQNTGKSCILNRFANNTFQENYQATIGLDFQTKNVTIHNQDIRLTLYDTAGQEKFRSLIPMYIREAQIILLVYDITNKESFDSIPKWFSDILNVKNDEAVFVLIGNKIDLTNSRKISYNEGKRLANEKNIIFEELSAKNGTNFNDLFNNRIFEAVYKKFKNKFDDIEKIQNNNNYESTESNEIQLKNIKMDNKKEIKKKRKKKCC